MNEKLEAVSDFIKCAFCRTVAIVALFVLFPFFSLFYVVQVFWKQLKYYVYHAIKWPWTILDSWLEVLSLKPILHTLKHVAVPYQNWLLKEIPWDYSDKPELIYGISEAAIVDFVEEENAFIVIDFDNETQKEFGRELKKNYHLIKVELPKLEAEAKQLSDQFYQNYKTIDVKQAESPEIKRLWSKISQNENKIAILRRKIVMFVAKFHEKLWT